MKAVVIWLSADGHTYEVWEDSYGYGYRKVRGFRTYDKARSFAEKEALAKGLEMQDNVALAEFDHSTSLSAEERLRRAIFGDEER